MKNPSEDLFDEPTNQDRTSADPKLTAQLTERITRCASETAGAELDLSGLGLEQFPVELLGGGQFPRLRRLNLRHNALTQLPETLGQAFPMLTTLNAADNALQKLPMELGVQLKRLERLNLENNKLCGLPRSFLARLNHLEELNIRGNQLVSLDDSLQLDSANATTLAKLEVLLLANNQLESLPKALGALPQLRVVDLGGNPALDAANVPDKLRRLHERNMIIHSRAKRRELITRALRVRSAVAQTLATANMAASNGSGKNK